MRNTLSFVANDAERDPCLWAKHRIWNPCLYVV